MLLSPVTLYFFHSNKRFGHGTHCTASKAVGPCAHIPRCIYKRDRSSSTLSRRAARSGSCRAPVLMARALLVWQTLCLFMPFQPGVQHISTPSVQCPAEPFAGDVQMDVVTIGLIDLNFRPQRGKLLHCSVPLVQLW